MKRVFAILLGNFLEFYDFTLFAYLIPIIAPLLFPSKEILDSYNLGYIFLAIGFLARPAGAFIFGYIGDYWGRKVAIVLSILIMSISTIVISLLPTGNESGLYVLAILMLCRIMQGLSAGGEYSGAGLLLVENSKNNQFFWGAILTASALGGAFVASIAAAMISISISPQESWRVLFFIGGIIGALTLWLRVLIKEPKTALKTSIHLVSNWKVLFDEHKL